MFRERDREAARQFYKKYIDVKGMSGRRPRPRSPTRRCSARTTSSRTCWPAGPTSSRRWRRTACASSSSARTRSTPTCRSIATIPNPAYQNERVRGTGGLGVTSFGEENLLNLPLDRYDDESIGVHEFCHTIDARPAPDRPRLAASGWARPTRTPSTRGCGRTPTPARNPGEYWAEICQSYFDCNRVNNWNHGPIGTREQLKQYDPEGYELVRDDLQPDARAATGATRRCGSSRASSRRRRSSRSIRTTRSSPGPASSRCSGRSTSATRRCSRPTTRSARCSPTGTTSSRR